MDMKHYLPEQQYLGQTIMSHVHEETGNVYLEIVESFDITSGLYEATYYEGTADSDELEAVLANWYTAAQLEAYLGQETP